MKLLFSKTWKDTVSGEEIEIDITDYGGDLEVGFYTDTCNIDMSYETLNQVLNEFLKERLK